MLFLFVSLATPVEPTFYDRSNNQTTFDLILSEKDDTEAHRPVCV